VINRIALAVILGYVAAFGLPMPKAPAPSPPSIDTPSSTLREAVQPVVVAMAGAAATDRAVLADLFSKVGRAVTADKDGETLFPDSRYLREYTRVAATLGWQRLAGNAPGKYSGLGDAIEKAFVATMGLESKAIDQAARQRFSDLCDAIAWAALQQR
jgi:hypothetical protein